MEGSNFCVSGRAGRWRTAFAAAQRGEAYAALVVSLPELEHSLRQVFVTANPECGAFMFTAEQENLYTTLDILLDSSVRALLLCCCFCCWKG